MKEKIKCPLCKGKSKIYKRILVDRVIRRKVARMLRKQGLTLLEIMRLLGYKSPRSVVLAVNRND